MRSTPQQRGWYVYDWALSAFSTSVITVFAGPYLTGIAEAAAGPSGTLRPLGIPVSAAAYYPYLVAASALLQVVAMPLVAAATDRSGRRRASLGASAFTGAAATAGLVLTGEDAYLAAGGLFLLATVAAGCSVVVANAYLLELAGPDRRDAVSSRGWALGYLGGGLLLAGHLALVVAAEAGVLALTTRDAARLAIATSALWWAGFTLVPLTRLGDRPPLPDAAAPERGAVPAGLHQLAGTFRLLRSARTTLLFLVAFLTYNDGVQTVISQSAVFADAELGLGQDTIAGAVLLVQFVAMAGAFGLGLLAERLGARRVILACLGVWIVACVVGYVLPAGRPSLFLALAALIGIVVGGTQALSRSLFSHMVPAGREAEYFSAFEIADRGTSWVGPLLFGLAVQFTGSYRAAIVSLVGFFLVGLVLLWRTDVRAAIAEAGNAAPSRV